MKKIKIWQDNKKEKNLDIQVTSSCVYSIRLKLTKIFKFFADY